MLNRTLHNLMFKIIYVLVCGNIIFKNLIYSSYYASISSCASCRTQTSNLMKCNHIGLRSITFQMIRSLEVKSDKLYLQDLVWQPSVASPATVHQHSCSTDDFDIHPGCSRKISLHAPSPRVSHTAAG